MPDVINRREETVGIDTIEPHPANPNDGDVQAIRESIRQIGFYGRLIVRESTAKILAGEHTWRAAQKEGMTEIPVEWVECDDDTAMRLLLADNATAEKAVREPEPLADLLQHLESTPDGLDGTGYMGDDLDELLDDLGRIPGNEKVDDPGAETSRAEELQAEWDTERGQLWQVGRHRLLCGDATDEADVGRLLDGAEPRLMVTDPPYGVEYEADWRNGALNDADRATGEVVNDEVASWGRVWELFPGEVAYTWHSDLRAGEAWHSLENSGFEVRAQIIGVKDYYVVSRAHYPARHEPCWYAVRKGANAGWVGPDNEETTWDFPKRDAVDGGHSTQKPIECHARPIRNHKGDVYEPFCGSGTGIIAAQQEGRTCYAMEIDPGYTAVILERCTGAGMECELIDYC